MSSYIGGIQIGEQSYKIGSSLYGICSTAADTRNKKVVLPDFDQLLDGITVFIKFISGNTAINSENTYVTLQFYADNEANTAPNANLGAIGAISVAENFLCQANGIISFTLDNVSGTRNWRVNNNMIIEEGTTNGTIKVNGQEISIHGLGSAAYTNSNAYATSDHTHSNYAPTESPTFTGTVTVPTVSDASANTTAATVAYVKEKTGGLSGLTGAMHFRGVATSEPSGSDEPSGIADYAGDNTMVSGDVVLYQSKEYVWNGTSWQLLGDEGSYALKTNNTTVSFTTNTLPTLTPSSVTVPNITNVGSAPSMTTEEVSIPNVTSAGSPTTASVANGILTITQGSAPTIASTNITATKITSWDAGSAPTQGTDITFDAIGTFTQGSQASININGTKVVTTT